MPPPGPSWPCAIPPALPRIPQGTPPFLLSLQLTDGRFVLLPDKPEDCWVTAPALLALHGHPLPPGPVQKAISFLLQHPGETADQLPEIFGHDTRLHGWPWIYGTHSWVDSTALVLLALRAHGLMAQPLFQEAVQLLLDRQLPTGGWNVGVKFVYETLSRPSYESTSIALAALSGIIPASQLARSTDYLQSSLSTCNTPLTLAWAAIACPGLFDPADTLRHFHGYARTPDPLPALPSEWLALMLLALDSLAGTPPPWIQTPAA
ncbi:MAG: terpene cyclase/mutase family protein [Bdellovibrionaceae bacterium]|nr:terpene cyclase/mutase family protein [Pseudobdellovibrionaceae bacterium]